MRSSRFVPAIVVLLSLLPGIASGQQTLYGLTGSQLITIDTATGTGTLIGPCAGGSFPIGLDFRAAKLYFLGQNNKLAQQVDPATGASIGGAINIALPAPLALEGDIAFRSDGIGFIATGSGGSFFSFDLTAANSAAIGPGPTPSIDGLAFDAADTLYALAEGGSQLYTLNQATGVATLSPGHWGASI